MFDDDSFTSNQFLEYASVGIVVAVRPVHLKFPISAGAEFEGLKVIGKAVWPPPLRQPGGVLERLVYLVS